MMSPAPSPGPALPGAWPIPHPPVDPLRLEHVLDFQQRLVSQMDQSEIPSSTSFTASVSADSAIAPADSLDSELTRFRTDTSTSIATSVSTTYTSRSSPERLVTAKLPPLAFGAKYSAVEDDYPTRIPRPTNSVRFTSDHTRSQSQRQNFFTSESPSPRSQNSCVPVPETSPSSSLGAARPSSPPVSPIVFASPTSSLPRFSNSQSSPHNRSSSYAGSSSPSWETSYGSEYDRHMLVPSPSPSPSPISSRANLALRPSSIANRTPSIEINAAVPLLTSLSLPASPETSMSLDTDPIVTRSPRLSPLVGDTCPWTLSLSPASPVLSNAPDLSLSSPVADNVVDGHLVSLSSPSSSQSQSPLPSPALGSIFESEDVGNTSAAEYAAAIMSSAWASEGPSLAPVIPLEFLSGENEVGSVVMALDAEQSRNALTFEEEGLLAYSQNARSPTSPQETRTSGVFGKMKKIGDKFKKLLRGKSKGARDDVGVNVNVHVGRAASPTSLLFPEALPDVIDIQSHTSAAQVYDSLLPNHGTDDSHLQLPLPPPPGLAVRKNKNRPVLSSQSYSSSLARVRMNDNTPRQNTPTIRIHPPSSSSRIATSNDDNVAPKLPSPDLTIHSRPKTLAEIKSKRRLSLSVLPNFTRVSSSIPPVNVITSNRHRTRPASALAFYPRPPPLSSLGADAQTDSNVPTSQRLEVPRSMSSGLTIAPAISGIVYSETAPASMALTSDNSHVTADATKKKNRRFSLSALSMFAGHRDEDSWGRNT
ncbi:hypothetical protein B0H12DRAFT_569773 [Mycena haematopus]|nr:hypothetical protein B0H12DRAFT_569773 [Mycena haematopus]